MASVEVAHGSGTHDPGRGFDPTWGATFTWAPYTPSTAPNHCVFCWAPFAEAGEPGSDARDEGYVTVAPISAAVDDCLWVCDSCFHENRDEFAWQVARANTA
jgi:hypothetical protein